MKTVLERLSEQTKDNSKFQLGISIFMILFFLLMGTASLFILINSPA